jgi:hypothetical protein
MLEEGLLKGIALAKAGNVLEARHILGQFVRANPQSVRGWLWLAGVVETKKQQLYCLEQVLQLNPQDEVCRQILARVRSDTMEQPVATDAQYFVGHFAGRSFGDQRHSEGTRELRSLIANALAPLGYAPYYADQDSNSGTEQQSRLLRLCQDIFSTSFGVFDLSSGDPNTYIELGIALGLNRPAIALANVNSSQPLVLKGDHVIIYTDHADLEAKLSRLRDAGFPSTTRAEPDYCHFCARVCASMSTPPDENSYLVLHHSKLLWRNLMQSLAPHLAEYHLYPTYLPGRSGGATLCDVRRQVLAARFVLCHLGALSDAESYLALGLAIGSRVPWVLLGKRGQDADPSDLKGADRLLYVTFDEIERPLTDTLTRFLARIAPSSTARNDQTTFLSLPVWMQLEDWIGRATQPDGASEAPQGSIRVAQYVGQQCVSERAIPRGGLVFGRSPDCDVVVGNPGVSSHHFRLLRGRTGKCFVEDLHSKNSTFLNGTRLPPGRRVEISLNDTIRIPGVRFLIWDDRPLPDEEAPQTFGNTGVLPPILRIEIPDVSPPTYLSTWDHSMVLTVRLPDGRHYATFEVQAYYPIGRILAKLVDLLDLAQKRYFFEFENKRIDDDETPLSVGIQTGDVLRVVPDTR